MPFISLGVVQMRSLNAKLARSIVASAVLICATAQAVDAPASGERIAIPGARSIDHVGQVVPDLEQAITFFSTVLGAAVLWRSAPFTADGRGPPLPSGLNADPRAVVRLAMMRLGPNVNVELLEYRVPGTARSMPLSSELAVGHIGFDVDDIDAAATYLRSRNVQMLEGPRRNPEGPNAGQDSWFFVSPWGMVLELIRRPLQMPYMRDTPARLYKAPPLTMAPSQKSRGAADTTEETILDLENERTQALLRGDHVTLKRLTAPDGVHVESSGMISSVAEFLTKAADTNWKFETFVVDENMVRFFGTTAVVTGRYHNSIRVRGELQATKYARHIRVWSVQPDGHWKVVSHQATEMPSDTRAEISEPK